MTVKLYERLQQISQAASIETLIFFAIRKMPSFIRRSIRTICYGFNPSIPLNFTQYGNTVDIVEIQEIVDYH